MREVVLPDEIVTVKCDVLSPNALGAILNDKTIPALHARVIAGGANNQLATAAHGDALRARGILYAPDYVINGGGIIRVAGQIYNWRDAEIEARVLAIADTLTEIFRRAESKASRPPWSPSAWPKSGWPRPREAAGRGVGARAYAPVRSLKNAITRSSASLVGVPGRSGG